MLTETTKVLGAALAASLLSVEEEFHLDALGSMLPHDWNLELKADVEMAWIAVIYCMDAPRSRPLFTICRWSDRTGLFARWKGEVMSSATAFTELQPVIGQVLSGVFACANTQPAKAGSRASMNTWH